MAKASAAAALVKFRTAPSTLTAAQAEALYVAARDAYYNTSTAILEDNEFDALEALLRRLKPKSAALKVVGAPVREGDKKVELPYWMGSLDKIRDDERAVERWKKEYPGAYVVSDKLDGNSALLVLGPAGMSMYSRGDGVIGQDISWLTSYVQGIPAAGAVREVLGVGAGATVAVRGELIFPRAAWRADMGANPRNVAAGLINSKNNVNYDMVRKLEFVAYELLDPHRAPATALEALGLAGFRVAAHRLMDAEALTMTNLSNHLLDRRANSPYEVDGIVVAHDAVHRVVKGKNPKYAFAFKSMLTHQEAEVIVTNVEWNVSKDGLMKPTVVFEPVHLAGVRIVRATGFNAAFIVEHKIGTGAKIRITRSGDVIPYITGVVTPAPVVALPEGETEWNETRVDLRLKASAHEGNDALAMKRMEHFAKTLGMRGVAAGVVARLHAGGVRTAGELLSVTKAKLMAMEGFQSKTADNLLAEIGKIKEGVPCVMAMKASNAFGQGFGERKLALVAAAFPDVARAGARAPTAAEVAALDGMGAKTAQAFLDALPGFHAFMKESGLRCAAADADAGPSAKAAAPDAFAGMVVVFTGVRDKELEARIEAGGGKVAGSVSKNTTVVVAKDPDAASGKLDKARDLGVRILDLAGFKAAYGA